MNEPVALVTCPGVIKTRTKLESHSVVKTLVTDAQRLGIWFFKSVLPYPV